MDALFSELDDQISADITRLVLDTASNLTHCNNQVSKLLETFPAAYPSTKLMEILTV